MTDERWIELLERIDRAFGVTDRTVEEVDDPRGEIETVTFHGPQGEMKLERTVKPVVLSRRMRYSNRIGAPPTVEYTYSPTEKSDRVRLFRALPSGEWEELDLDAMFGRPGASEQGRGPWRG